MKVLLDTNIVLFIVMDDPRLKPRTLALISEEAAQRWVSVVSLWEIAIKFAAGKLPVDAARVLAALEPSRLSILGLETSHVLMTEGLPVLPHHRDPFDRLLLAQAKAEDLTFVTADTRLAEYGVPLIAA